MSELIKRIDEFYVGFKPQGANDLPLAFLTPYDTTAAFKKRKETVDTWAQGYGRYVNGKLVHDPRPDPINIKNEPVDGFKIAKSVKRTGGWNSGNVVWRIEDPRGFEWEIPSANLAQIITQTGISAGGVINGRCVIGRLGSTNILIPEGTDLWDQMESDVQTRKTRDSAKILTDLRPGDAITLKNGETGFYLGKRKVLLSVPEDKDLFERVGTYQYQLAWKRGFCAVPSKNEYHLIVVGLNAYNYKEDYYPVRVSKGNPPVVAVDHTKGITPAEIDKMLSAPKCYPSFAGKALEDSQDIKSII
jgi:hypothetical protein